MLTVFPHAPSTENSIRSFPPPSSFSAVSGVASRVAQKAVSRESGEFGMCF